MKTKKGDFIEIEYTGKLKEDNIIFDTTDSEVAKKNNIFDEKYNYKPVIICLGEKHIIPGLDDKLTGKDLGNYTIEIAPEKGFGKKDPKLLQLIPASKFKKQGIAPQVGLQVDVDNSFGVIRAVSGGRIIVDFNHPLSGKDLIYDVKINKQITEKKLQLSSLVGMMLNIKEPEVELKEDKAIVYLKIPDQLAVEIIKKITELTGIKTVEFREKKEKEEQKQETKEPEEAKPVEKIEEKTEETKQA